MDQEKAKKIADYNVSRCLEEVFYPDKMKEFLHVCAQMHAYDYRNQLLIWKQNKDAKVVAGIEAVKALGLTLPDESERMILLCPVIELSKEGVVKTVDGEPAVDKITEGLIYEVEPEYSSENKVVMAYNVTNDTYTPSSIDFNEIVSLVRKLTSFVIAEGDDEVFTGSEKGFLDLEARTIYVRKGLKDTDFRREVVRAYITNEFKEVENNETKFILQRYTEYVVFDYLGIMPGNASFVSVKKIRELPEEEQRWFLNELSNRSAQILEDLTEPILSFTEIQIANSLLTTDSFDDLVVTLFMAKSSIEDPALQSSIELFEQKLAYSQDGYLSGLYEAVKSRSLYSYPPYPMVYELYEH